MANAIDLLKEDHAKVRNLLAKLAATSKGAVRTREDLLARIEQELKVHAKLEEEIFYPAFREAAGKECGTLYQESLEEHHIIDDVVLEDVEKADNGSEVFSGRAKVLREMVEHHASDEEEEMFPVARKVLSDQQLEELGARMEERRRQLLD